MYSCGPLHMDEQWLDDQLEPKTNNSAPTQDVAWKTYQERWKIETKSERGSRKYMLEARHDDHDDTHTHTHTDTHTHAHAHTHTHIYIYIYIYIYVSAQLAKAVEYIDSISVEGYDPAQRVSWIWNSTICRWDCCNAGALGNVEYSFITIAPRFILRYAFL